MLNAVTLAALGLLAFAAPQAAPATPAAPATGTYAGWPDEIPASLDWRIEPADAGATAGLVQVEIGYHSPGHSSMWGESLALSTLDGLSPGQLSAPGQPVSFVMRRDAGEFRCHGVAGEGRGVGTCVYAANPGFPAALARRGVTGELAPIQQFRLAMSDIGLAYLDELKREAYATPTADDLVKAGTHGAGLRQLRAMDAAGYRFGDLATFVQLRDHGVSARYVEALRAQGYTGLSAADLQRLRDHGVSETYIAELKAGGYSGLKPDDLARLRDHGVSVGFISGLHAAGYAALAPDDLMRLRDHGISVGFIQVANAGGKRLSPDDLIRLRDRGGRE
ncbi:hypothetical protein [Phenylobacterium sp.]|uniref:hypothetical protein n=1 Tax=Phenylobacterium sp. TaxID=1871053 RepID=UPI0035636320